MDPIVYSAQVMWSMLDANMHLRHSAYSDLATQGRMELLQSQALSIAELGRIQVGPLLFREELVYHREVRATDTVQVSCLLRRAKRDGSRWQFVQKLYRQEEGVLAATVTVEGAWLDLEKRKLCPLPPFAQKVFGSLDRTADFEWLDDASS